MNIRVAEEGLGHVVPRKVGNALALLTMTIKYRRKGLRATLTRTCHERVLVFTALSKVLDGM